MKVKFSGSNIILSAESAEEARVLQAARANSERKERVRCSRTWVGDVDSETDHPALTLTLERLKPVDCDLDRKHAIAEPVVFPKVCRESSHPRADRSARRFKVGNFRAGDAVTATYPCLGKRQVAHGTRVTSHESRMTTFDLILAYPLTALGVFLAAVAALWLCLSAALWAAGCWAGSTCPPRWTGGAASPSRGWRRPGPTPANSGIHLEMGGARYTRWLPPISRIQVKDNPLTGRAPPSTVLPEPAGELSPLQPQASCRSQSLRYPHLMWRISSQRARNPSVCQRGFSCPTLLRPGQASGRIELSERQV